MTSHTPFEFVQMYTGFLRMLTFTEKLLVLVSNDIPHINSGNLIGSSRDSNPRPPVNSPTRLDPVVTVVL
jgi:hypothetical protein